MFKTTLISLIGHIVFFFLFIAAAYIQPRYIKIPKDKITRVRFQNLPRNQIVKPAPKTPQPIIQKPVSMPKPKSMPKPPETPPKKQITKPTPVPPKPETPRKKITRPDATPKATPKQPASTPIPQHTASPAPPRNTPVPPPPNPRSPSPAGTSAPSVPLPNKPPLEIVQEDLPDYYLLLATQKIESNFKLTKSQRFAGVYCVVEFNVSKNGEISGTRVVKSTGQPSLDRFAVTAVERTETLGPLPDTIGKSSIIITATFEYSPESE
jgi:protein TonB